MLKFHIGSILGNALYKLHFDKVKSRFIEMFGDPRTNPKGWTYGKLMDICTKITDGEHGSVERLSKGRLYLMARNITKNNKLDLTEVSYISEEDHQKLYNRCNPESGDLLLVCVGATIGKVTIVPHIEQFSMARSVALIKPNYSVVNSEFLLQLIAGDYIQQQMKNCIHTAAQGGLYTNMIKSLDMFVPPIAIQNQFASFVNKVDKLKFEMGKRLCLSKELSEQYNKGYSKRNLFRMIKFYEAFTDYEIVTTLSAQLT